MAVKNVALAEDAYKLLASHKRPGESFSDVVRRLAGRPNPVDYIGAWADLSDKDVAKMKRDIKQWRKSSDAKLRRKRESWER